MAALRPLTGPDGGLLKIGEAATLTGVSPGRIRHYQSQGLLQPARSSSGYRYFSADDLVRLLQVDLLRSLGMGLIDIRNSLPGQVQDDSLRDTLQRHRATLRVERDRLERLLVAIDLALESEDASAESVATLLSSANSTPRDSLGIFGRLSKPLSEEAAQIYQDILGGGWGLPVPSIFGRMLLPAAVTELLEQVAHAHGYQELFQRVRDLAVAILGLPIPPVAGPHGPQQVAEAWLQSLAVDPLPSEVQLALDQSIPRIRELEVLNQGFQLWAESISPPAAAVLRFLEDVADRRGLVVLGVLIAKRRSRRRPRVTPRLP
ncbi:MAG TPA: MerR family transcriptional regulator [Candidatus Dormibacteraeota bacterium]|nr:MerR family transcriptional regulator [Candidatus Dormibacteraeota bacterium]